MIKILFVCNKFDYGKPEKGLSTEHVNFYDCLTQMSDVQASFFGLDEEMLAMGRDAMNQKLIRVVEETKPDLLFCFLLTEELKKETIEYITTKTTTKTFNWFADDHWRIPIFSRHWAPLFTLVSTTDSDALAVYKSYGITNVIKTQWGANPYAYFPQDQTLNQHGFNISFVGQNYGKRGAYINRLQSAGLDAAGYGGGWPGGRVTHQRMLEIFSFSKINLNFTETYYHGPTATLKKIAKLFLAKELGSYKFTAHHFADNWRSMKGTSKKCIKGRVFEVPACGGFLLTAKSDDPIEEYYVPGKEVVVFDGLTDLLEKCKYYLAHETERQAIAKAGFDRTLKDHTYVRRFEEIFKTLGLK